MAVIFDSTAEGVVLAVGELAEFRLAVTKHHCDVSHSACNNGVKAGLASPCLFTDKRARGDARCYDGALGVHACMWWL